MSEHVRSVAKISAFIAATLIVVPALVSFKIRALAFGPDRALEGSSQCLSLVPGILGQFLRRAFYARVLQFCHPSATIEFGALFSKTEARVDEHAYIGPGCHLGLTHIERDVLLGPNVTIPSGGQTHGSADPHRPIREQEGVRRLVRIGAGSWVGAGAIIMADVGRNCVIAAGAVVVDPIPNGVLAAGVPARVIRERRPA